MADWPERSMNSDEKNRLNLWISESNKTEQQKQDASEQLIILKTADKELYQKLQDYFCLTPTQVQKVLKEYNKNPERISDNLAYVENKYQKGEVENIGAYTLKAIQENYNSQASLFDIEKQQKKERARV